MSTLTVKIECVCGSKFEATKEQDGDFVYPPDILVDWLKMHDQCLGIFPANVPVVTKID